jgi:hypothetical protein
MSKGAGTSGLTQGVFLLKGSLFAFSSFGTILTVASGVGFS